MSTADTLKVVVEKTLDPGDHDKFQHYCSKKDIEANMFEGKPLVALCGKVILQQVDPKGRTICPSCKEIMDRIFGPEENN